MALSKIIFNQDIIFMLILTSFLLIAILKGYYWKHAKLLFMGVFAQRYANQFLREENAFTERVNAITFFLMSINFTLIILKITQSFELLSVGLILVYVSGFFLFKMGLIKLLGFILKTKDLSKLAVFFSMLFDRTLGFLLFPLVVLLYFFSFEVSTIVLVISFVLFLILILMKLFWIWKLGTNSFGLPQFYIFLYLCTLEIFPLLILGKGVFY
ncbi:MAG: DUF4271 domain-containing protein [Flavobacteriales bacterium]|nr:DUF4271 domain-containing protein [Flavobacteriales bacterium]